MLFRLEPGAILAIPAAGIFLMPDKAPVVIEAEDVTYQEVEN